MNIRNRDRYASAGRSAAVQTAAPSWRRSDRSLPLALLVILAMASLGCAQQETEQMSPDELHALIRSGAPPLVLDVRTRREYRASHVPGAVHRPFHHLLGRDPQVPGSKNLPLVVYCEHGPRAGIAAWGLRRSGFTQIVYLQGNMAAWKKRDLPVESGSDVLDEVD